MARTPSRLPRAGNYWPPGCLPVDRRAAPETRDHHGEVTGMNLGQRRRDPGTGSVSTLPPLNRLQEPFLTETRIIGCLAPGVVLVQSPVVGQAQPVCFLLDTLGTRRSQPCG